MYLPTKNRTIFLLHLLLKLFLIAGVIIVSIIAYLVYYYSKDLPDYSQLANYHPPSTTRFYSRDGKLIEEYAIEHRVFVPLSNIPHSVIEAFIAAEDKNFFSHPGVDIISIARSAIMSFTNIFQHRRMQGGSTITQQVVKNFLLSPEYSLERKIKEAILSYMISQVFTKEQILELYLNQSYLGHGAYGVTAAAQTYFNKSIEELNVEEAAMLAGLLKAPSAFNPEKNYTRAKERRDYVLTRMLEDGYITEQVASKAIATPIKLVKRSAADTIAAGYYAEKVREEVINIFGKDYFYKGGLTVITALDSKTQQDAQDALINGIREYDRKTGFRGRLTNITITDWQTELAKIKNPVSILEYKLAVILELFDTHATIGLCDGSISKIPLSEMLWAKTNIKSPRVLFAVGDVIVVEQIKEHYALRQIPLVNGGIVVMNPTTGQVTAACGGYDFNSSKFDRVTQALRQPGSLIKPFIYLTGLENNIPPNRIFTDGPIEISQGIGMPIWRPKNYKGDFLGNITMRSGLEKSRNLVTVRVAQEVGITKVAEMIKRFAVNNDPKIVYSMVLGSIETTLLKMTTAYAKIANAGYKIEPKFIELIKDRNGKVIYSRSNAICTNCIVQDLSDIQHPNITHANSTPIVDEASIYQITSMLTGVVQRGTASAAQKLDKIIAGKTGTSNDSMDTWFIGFTPRIVVGTYIGYDAPKTLGKRATGASVALPVFINFMQSAYSEVPSLPFVVPDSIQLVRVNAVTGEITHSPNGIVEALKIQNNHRDDHDIFEHIHNNPPITNFNKEQSPDVY